MSALRQRRTVRVAFVCAMLPFMLTCGCQSNSKAGMGEGMHAGKSARPKTRPVRRVRCLYEQWPWLNLDVHGDADPEGMRYRVFLDPSDGRGKGVHRDGTFYIEIYRIDHGPDGKLIRTLASDYTYPTDHFTKIGKGLLGEGYLIQLLWADKGLAGREIELITRFEDPFGRKARSGTKRLKVPKYDT